MMGARAAHPSCAYEWLKYMSRPDVQSQVAQWNGVAPANPGACSGTAALSQQFCTAYHITDRSYVDKVLFAKTPEQACGADRRDCSDYAAWTIAWRDALK
jgi:putative spermidine/putrescine transport system substrate-binding protein